MKNIEHVLIAGAGAIGLMVAHQIYTYNAKSVSILARGERLSRYQKNGLWVNDEKIDFHLADADSKAEDSGIPTKSGKTDLVILACKNQHLDTILDDLQNYIGDDTLIISLLNGISSEQTIKERYPNTKPPLAMILGTDAQHGNEHCYYGPKGVIHFGENTNKSIDGKANSNCTDEVQSIAAFFEKSNIAYNVPENMLRMLWFKYMVNVGINQASSIMRLPYAPFQNNGNEHFVQEAFDFMVSLQKEVIEVSKHVGANLDEADLEKWFNVLTTLTPDSRTSMCQDVIAGRKTEVELFSKTVSALGKKHGVATPVNDVVYLQLRAIEQSYACL